jgi:hypothetical protein
LPLEFASAIYTYDAETISGLFASAETHWRISPSSSADQLSTQLKTGLTALWPRKNGSSDLEKSFSPHIAIATHSRRLRRYQPSAADPDANNRSVDGSGFCTSLDVETEAPAVLRACARPVEEGTVRERERGMVVVTEDWKVGDVPDVVRVVLVVVVTPAPVPEFTAEPFCAAGRRVPPPLSGKSGDEEPTVVGVNGWTGAANGAAAPASGNGLKTLTPVAGVGGAFPMTGDALNVVGDVASGAELPNSGNGLKTLPPVETKGAVDPDAGNGLKTPPPLVTSGVEAPENWNGLKTLPPLVTLVCPTVEVVTVVCWNVTAPTCAGSSPASLKSKSAKTRTKKIDLFIIVSPTKVLSTPIEKHSGTLSPISTCDGDLSGITLHTSDEVGEWRESAKPP